ncbi:MAG: protein-glutamate O-methyltransferase CheR [Deltaproteobacteria bacterium]|nr:protein-glutamate O-methyltransferase CheR [Deltaproteobacteria bacterium]
MKKNQNPFLSSSTELSDVQFNKVKDLIYRECGICLKSGKEALVRARLTKRLRALGMGSFDEYVAYLENDGDQFELTSMVDVMTTNKTSFFREIDHFHFLRDTVHPGIKSRKIRVWSAGCSSGEEPYTHAMVLFESLPDIDSRDALILATDISTRMVRQTKSALYSDEKLATLPKTFLNRYFTKTRANGESAYQVVPRIRKIVRTARLNLMDPWPMKGPFDAIFCRNVMIYFDTQTQHKLVNRFWELLRGGGYLFVGHSEGLSSIKHQFRYQKPAVYKK